MIQNVTCTLWACALDWNGTYSHWLENGQNQGQWGIVVTMLGGCHGQLSLNVRTKRCRSLRLMKSIGLPDWRLKRSIGGLQYLFIYLFFFFKYAFCSLPVYFTDISLMLDIYLYTHWSPVFCLLGDDYTLLQLKYRRLNCPSVLFFFWSQLNLTTC